MDRGGMSTTRQLVDRYVRDWSGRGYKDDIPDEVPNEIMRRSLAPSYKAIALALLNNDMRLTSLGFSAPRSDWYDVIKKIEINNREKSKMPATDTSVASRITELRESGKTIPEVADLLNKEGIRSLSGKPWSTFMVMNYGKAAKTVGPEDKPIKSVSQSEYKARLMEQRLMELFMRNIELEAEVAVLRASRKMEMMQ